MDSPKFYTSKRLWLICLSLIGLAGLVTACDLLTNVSDRDDESNSQVQAIETNTNNFESPLISPLPLPTTFTSPVEEPRLAEKYPFSFDKPLQPGQTVISGTGPPGVPINIVDISYGGEVLGAGTADKNGTFSITTKPLLENNRVGIMLGDMSNYPAVHVEELIREYEFQDLPLVGRVFASEMVR